MFVGAGCLTGVGDVMKKANQRYCARALLFVGDSEAGGFVYLIDGFIQQSLEYPELLVGIRYHANLLLQLLNSEIRRFSSVLPPRAQLKEPDCVGRTEVTLFHQGNRK